MNDPVLTPWGRRALLIGIIIMLGILIVVALTDHAGAAPLAGNKGGCGRHNMTTVTCNVTDAGRGFVSGDCELGYWFSRVSTLRTFRVGQIVTARGCLGERGELYSPIRISTR